MSVRDEDRDFVLKAALTAVHKHIRVERKCVQMNHNRYCKQAKGYFKILQFDV